MKILGVGVQGFAKGPDGGCDVKFIGTAQHYPSDKNRWSGTMIIQAKHTNRFCSSCSDKKFYSEKSSHTVIGEEIPRIKKLRAAKQLDYYMLFTNRRLSATANTKITEYISKQCEIPVESISLCGLEKLDMYFNHFPEAVHHAGLDFVVDFVDSPLIVRTQELAEIIEALAQLKEKGGQVLPDDSPVIRAPYKEKNELNQLSQEYEKEWRRIYLKEEVFIRNFLAAPENTRFIKMYISTTEDFQFKIIAKRKDYHSFDALVESLMDVLFNRDSVLAQSGHRSLTRALLFYMYWNCDIGKKVDNTEEAEDAASNETLTS
ncbi:ABC-three component system protein [Xylella fastidiosa]|nr:ABC-three component system protein [Xylella fastidiosa]